MGNAALTTYRYLRIGIVGAIVALFVAVLIERSEVDCFQTSLSAYYYTPVRAIFVGALFVVGFALIVIRGRTTPIDVCLNFAGILAPLVAVAPTVNVGTCWSIEPVAFPVDDDGNLAPWVSANVDNNVLALLITGAIGWAVAAVISVVTWARNGRPAGAGRGLIATLAFLIVVWVAFATVEEFDSRAHGIAAVVLFVFLALTVLLSSITTWREDDATVFAMLYLAIFVAMALTAVVVWMADWDHKVLILEIVEIALFGLFWVLQTIQWWGASPESSSELSAANSDPSVATPAT